MTPEQMKALLQLLQITFQPTGKHFTPEGLAAYDNLLDVFGLEDVDGDIKKKQG